MDEEDSAVSRSREEAGPREALDGSGHALQLGIDIGGTFTDVSLREANGQLINFKTPTRSDDPARGIGEALDALAELDVSVEKIGYFVHGTTVALNSIIQRTGATTALVVTEGFSDLLELARLRIPVPYSFYSRRPAPLVPRYRIVPVHERVLHDGTVATSLDDGEIQRVVEVIRTLQVESVAICLLHSYVLAAHEVRVKHALLEAEPGLFVSCSSEIWPEIREYERALVTVMNAYVGPPAARYLQRLDEVLRARRVSARAYVTRSNGGIMTSETAQSEPVHILLSGPASGVIGATKIASGMGLRDFITFDMGGTSADIAVIEDGRVAYSVNEHVGEFPVIIPTVAISSIGAGGGSIAEVDAAGILRVGPSSAGADPGPACYGLGGRNATVTDAFLMCGYLNPRAFAGKDELDEAASQKAIEKIGVGLGLDAGRTANGILEVALANMYGEMTAVLERRGIDPREFVLVAFGGAGPLMACNLADEIAMSRVLFPPSPGTLCAFGALNADIGADFVRSVNWRPSEIMEERVRGTLDDLADAALTWLHREAPMVDEAEVRFSADLRYVGQSYEIEVPITVSDAGELWPRVLSGFHDAHERLFGQSDPEAVAELISLRARAVGSPFRRLGAGVVLSDAVGLRRGRGDERREIRVRGRAVSASVVERAVLVAGDIVHGPAIIEQPDTTILLPSGWSGEVDRAGNILATQGNVG